MQEYENFKDIQLDLNGHNNNDINDYIRSHFELKYMNDDDSDNNNNTWKCDKCNKKSKSLQSMKIFRLPKILTIVLKRFEYKNGQIIKNNKEVSIPDRLELDSFTIKNQYTKNCKYELRAMSIHSGILNGGHYTSCCKSINDNDKYFHVNDTIVKEIETFEYINNPYLIFYEQVIK